MRHRIVATRAARLLGALVVTSSLSLGLAATPAQASDEPATRAIESSFDDQVIALVNVERAERDLKPLRAASCVDRFAAKQASAMARKNRMYHQALRPVLRECNLRTAGENVAWRSPSMSAAQVVRMWMKSPGHKRNILSKRYRTIGVDAVQHTRSGRVYAAQVFGS